MTSVLIRIALRYLAGLLVAKGLISTGMGTELASDPDVIAVIELAVGTIAAIAAEWWWWLARRFSWER